MKEFIIVGNPNCGKTTLFNCLTHQKERTGNYSGVTTKEKESVILYAGKKIKIVDLPGVYSYYGQGEDEKAALNYLKTKKDANIVFLCSSSALTKNLILLTELKEFKNIKIIVNEIGTKLKQNVIKQIERLTGLAVLSINASKNRKKILEYLLTPDQGVVSPSLSKTTILNSLFLKGVRLTKIDNILLQPFLGKIIFVAVISLVLILSFGRVGGFLSSLIESPLIMLKTYLIKKLSSSPILLDFLCKVIIDGVCSVIVFLPQLALMLIILNMLEDLGYLPRVGKVFNYSLNKLGMTGKSVFSLVMGLGCTTSSYLCTRNVGEKAAKEQTAKMLPFVGCSARLPVFLLAGSMVIKSSVLWLVFLYFISILVGAAVLKFTQKNHVEDIIFELPPLKMPSINLSIKKTVFILTDLLRKIIFSCFAVSVVVWLLSSINVNLEFFNGGKSLLVFISEKIMVIFKPIGLDNVSFITALIAGLVAKENILSTLGMLGGMAGITNASMVSFCLFVLLYTPCVPALVSLKKEFGSKILLKTIILHLGLAYLISFVFYTFASCFGMLVGTIVLVSFCVLLLLFSMMQKTKCSCGCGVVCKNFVKKCE